MTTSLIPMSDKKWVTLNSAERYDHIKSNLMNLRPSMKMYISEERALDRMHEAVKNSIYVNVSSASKGKNTLLSCTYYSLIRSVFNAFEIGLEPDTPAQEGFLIPLNNPKLGIVQAHFWPGYKGIMKNAVNLSGVRSISTDVVYQGEIDAGYFEVLSGTDLKVYHKKILDPKERGEIAAFYALAWWRDTSQPPLPEIMIKKQIDDIRDASFGKNGEPWTKHYVQQGRKTTVKRIGNYLPRTDGLARTIQIDNASETGSYAPLTEEQGAILSQFYEGDIAKTSTDKLADKFKKADAPSPDDELPPVNRVG